MKRLLLVLLVFLMIGFCPADDIVGWRVDGTGLFPKAKPPMEWAADRNVVWRTKMPGRSNSSPVLVGDRIFVCSEPGVLLCVDRKDGKILWQKENTYADVPLTPEERQQLEVENKQADELSRQRGVLDKEASVLRKKFADEVEKGPTQKLLDDNKKLADALKEKLTALPLAMKFRTPGKDGTGGWSSCTPVTDGKSVYVAFGNGLVAAFDLEGNRRWIRLIEHPTVTYGHGATPLLSGDKLLVHYADLVGLDTKDGSERWRTKMPPSHGTPIAATIEDTAIAVTPGGAFVRIADGKILASNLGNSGPNSPILHAGIVYWIAGSARAAKLPVKLTEPLTVEALWKGTCQGGDYFFASPIVHDGLAYVACGNKILTVLDATTGKLVYEKRLDLGRARVYPSLALAGGRLFLSADDGVTLVLEPGREYKELSRCSLEEFRSSPVFAGQRLYIRGYQFLYCIGETP